MTWNNPSCEVLKIHHFSVKPKALYLSLQRSDMSIEGNTSNLRAPAERNVYSKRESAPFSRFPFF